MEPIVDVDQSEDQFQFIEGAYPKEFRPDYIASLYNTESHRKLQAKQGWHSFHIIRSDKRKVIASIHFCIEDKVAYSPRSAPFGSFELSDSVTPSQLFRFISFCEEGLLNLGVKKILVKNFPEVYSKWHSSLSILLFNHQYSVKDAELGAIIFVDEGPFINKIDPWEKRKLKQGKKAGLKLKAISNKKLKEVFHFILECRKERGQSLSMSFAQLNKTVAKLNKYFFCFGVYHGNELVAASIAIKVNKTVLYNFYSAHTRSSDSLSPVVFLMGGMHDWCFSHKIGLLDLGTSALGGKPNFSLIDFKFRLGATPAMKLTFEKELK